MTISISELRTLREKMTPVEYGVEALVGMPRTRHIFALSVAFRVASDAGVKDAAGLVAEHNAFPVVIDAVGLGDPPALDPRARPPRPARRHRPAAPRGQRDQEGSMSHTNRCHECDLPLATPHDYDTIAEGQGGHLCWRAWNTDVCAHPKVDWRARALTAERPAITADEVRAVVRSACLMVLEDQSATVSRNDCVLRRGTKERRQALEFCSDVIAGHVAENLAGRVLVGATADVPSEAQDDLQRLAIIGSECESLRTLLAANAKTYHAQRRELDAVNESIATVRRERDRWEALVNGMRQERDAARAKVDGLRIELDYAKRASSARTSELESQLAALSAELDQAHQAGAAMAVRVPRETSASIAAWADETFGKPETNMSIWERAACEFGELRFKLMADDSHPGAAEECADVCIVLDRLVHRLGKDMAQERDRKMGINRDRQWTLTGDGHGQHVEDGKAVP